jgi:hypothetical protein
VKIVEWLLKYEYDSKEECLLALVGSHNEFVDKSLLYKPTPISFLACVIKKELFIIELFNTELRAIHLCCLDESKLLFILKSKN